MAQFEVCRKTWSHFSFDMNCLISAYEPFVFSDTHVTWRSFSSLHPKEQSLEGLLSLLINLFIPLLNKHLLSSCYAPGREPCHFYKH